MNRPIFITGIGTGVGKTIIAAIVAKALQADYWKPIQAGFEEGTDALTVRSLAPELRIHPELYKLELPASPHIAAAQENIQISIDKIVEGHKQLPVTTHLVIEGAGGLLVPLNDEATIADLIKALNARVILVSRNYLGSINHSLLTAAYCKVHDIDVIGWVFNDQFMDYEADIVERTGIPSLGSVPNSNIDTAFITSQSDKLRPSLLNAL